MDTNEMLQEFITAFPQVIGEHVRAQLGKPVQHTLTAAQAERLNRWPGRSYSAGQVVEAQISGMKIGADSDGAVREYIDLRLAGGTELTTVPRPWTEEL
ncbi:hypothetical protein [Micromonospora rifamycinica]|nr:hypothetical protein [Micromonospora rifamycinica]KWV29756.1 hypothetical protein AWV63_26720 [Micromonospora rifamycinica]